MVRLICSVESEFPQLLLGQKHRHLQNRITIKDLTRKISYAGDLSLVWKVHHCHLARILHPLGWLNFRFHRWIRSNSLRSRSLLSGWLREFQVQELYHRVELRRIAQWSTRTSWNICRSLAVNRKECRDSRQVWLQLWRILFHMDADKTVLLLL